MHSILITSFLLGIALHGVGISAGSQEAPIVRDNPTDATYEVVLLNKNTTSIRGWLTATASHDGVGVMIQTDFWGFPDEGPFQYHVHEVPVPANGNCTQALAHLDPYQRGETPPCDIDAPESCQVGDLSGKHGPIWVAPGEAYRVQYTDFFLSTSAGSPAFFGNRSIVLHSANGTRLNCGNFMEIRHHKSTAISAATEQPAPTTASKAVQTNNPSTVPSENASGSTASPKPPTSSITSPASFLNAAPTHAGEFSASVMLAAIVAFML